MKFWWQFTVDAARHPAFVDALQGYARRIVSPGTEVSFHGMDPDIGRDLSQTEILCPPVYASTVVPLFLRNALRAQREGCDAFIIGTFAEPVLHELRSLCAIPVISAFESTVFTACSVAPRVGLLGLSAETVPFLEASIERHRIGSRVSGIHMIDRVMTERSLDQQFAAPEEYLERFRAGARKAIAAGAEAVIPAEGVVAAIVAINGLRDVDGVPVIDSVAVPMLAAEHMVTLKQRLGLQASRPRAYAQPSARAIERVFG
jgi:allantoin racemase